MAALNFTTPFLASGRREPAGARAHVGGRPPGAAGTSRLTPAARQDCDRARGCEVRVLRTVRESGFLRPHAGSVERTWGYLTIPSRPHTIILAGGVASPSGPHERTRDPGREPRQEVRPGPGRRSHP